MKCLILLALVVLACGRPQHPTFNRRYKPMENPDLFQGDILGIESFQDRSAVPYDQFIWPKGIIPYRIGSGLRYYKDLIEEALDYLESKTCLTFIPRTSQRDYVKFFPGEGCYSHWGKTGGEQPISIGDGCEDLGIIIHEVLHAVGFDHEQNRSDRDEYITILWNNIIPDAYDQFEKHKPHENRLFDIYDYESIMQYGETAFSVDDIKPTMKAKKRGVRLRGADEKVYPSKSDIYRVKKLYKC